MGKKYLHQTITNIILYRTNWEKKEKSSKLWHVQPIIQLSKTLKYGERCTMKLSEKKQGMKLQLQLLQTI